MVPAVLAGATVAVAWGAPGPGALRLNALYRLDRRAAHRGPEGRAAQERHRGPVGYGVQAPGGPYQPDERTRPEPRDRVSSRRWLPAALGVAGLLLAGPAVAAAATLAGLLVPRLVTARERGRAGRVERDAVVEACAALAAELRAGRTPAEALAVAAALTPGPAGRALRSAAAAAGWGGDVPEALRAGAGDSAVPEVLRALAACWQVCASAGSGLAAAVDSVADGVRARRQQELAVAAALAGPRASAVLLALLPLVGTALAAGLGARPVHVLLHTPLGVGCLVVGAGLDLLGLLWTRTLVARAAGTAG